MKVSEVKAMFAGQFADVEVYKFIGGSHSLHTDYIESIDDYDDDAEVLEYELMDQDRYDTTILANGCVKANFSEWYDDANAKVLVIVIR